MISKSLFRKNFAIFTSITLVFIVIALSAAWILTSFERNQMHLHPAHMNRALLKALDEDPFKAIIKLNELSAESRNDVHDLIDSSGRSLVTRKQALPRPLSEEELRTLERDQSISINLPGLKGPPSVLSETHQANIFLLSQMGPPPKGRPIGPLVVLISLVTCVLISIAVALLYQTSKYHARALEAYEVLMSLRKGNLSARLPQRKFDELSKLTVAFNEMAADIENMVTQLKHSDQARRQLLQDLAHDLRTPLTSLKTFLEAIKEPSEKISPAKHQEILSLCFSEVEYFGNLVEDLLFLAQITEPKYSLGTEAINLKERIAEQLTVFKERYPHICFEFKSTGDDLVILGSPKLIDRLLRNALDNSTSYAKSSLVIHLAREGERIDISLLDDGPGFSPRALSEFGHKKSSRVLLDSESSMRISVGIGSVIMKEIAQLHSGQILAENLVLDNRVLGAKVSISFHIV